jgi:hypothetical protein
VKFAELKFGVNLSNEISFIRLKSIKIADKKIPQNNYDGFDQTFEEIHCEVPQ